MLLHPFAFSHRYSLKDLKKSALIELFCTLAGQDIIADN